MEYPVDYKCPAFECSAQQKASLSGTDPSPVHLRKPALMMLKMDFGSKAKQ